MRQHKKKLTDEQKAFVVQRLACWDTPGEAAEALKEEYGVTITPQGCETYDPNKRAGARLAKKWRELYANTREAFLKDLETYVPEANKGVRIRMLANAARGFRGRGNYVGMASMLEQIAKECGGSFTNRREFMGKDGGAIKIQAVEDMTKEQIEDELRGYGIDPDVHRAPIAKQ